MGVYIPNMEKPKECGDCNFVQAFWDDKRWLFRCLVTDKIAEDCPLIDIVTCGECKWWDKDGDRPFGYCHAEKHCHFSTNWEISIYRTYKSDHFCSDGERRSE